MLPILVSIGTLQISTFGVMSVLAFFAGAFVIWKKGKEEHFEEDQLFDLALLTTFWGLVGARVWYVMEHWGDFWPDGLKMVMWLRYPGLSWWGAFIAGTVVVVIFTRKLKWNVFEAYDLLSLGVAVALIWGFVGQFLNGSGYGIYTNLPWGISFPGVEGVRHPTQIYAWLLYLGLAVILFRVFAKYRIYEWYKGSLGEGRPGLVWGVFLIGGGLVGMLLAGLKPVNIVWLGWAVEGWLSLAIFVAGLVVAYGRSGRSFKADASYLGSKVMGLTKGLGKVKKPKIVSDKSSEKPTREVREVSQSRRHRRRRARGITAGMDVK